MRRRSLVVATHGAFVGKTGRRLVVRTRSGDRVERPAREVDLLLVAARGVTVSVEALRLAVESGVPVFFAHPSGYPYAAVMPVVSTGSADTRREQILAAYDERGTELAREFVRGKLANQAGLLRAAAASRRRTNPGVADRLASAAERILGLAGEVGSVSGTLDSGAAERLRSLESEAARAYWSAFSLMVPGGLGFPGRVTLGAEDLVNCLLNYGYGVLRARVSAAVFLAGLDLYAGYLHVDRAGRPSLALDLMEEFRPIVVDRAVLTLLGRGRVRPSWLEPSGELSREAISTLLEALDARLDSRVRCGALARRVTVRTAIRLQARLVVSHLKGGARYRAVSGWS